MTSLRALPEARVGDGQEAVLAQPSVVWCLGKRAIDIVVAVAGLLVVAPVLLVIAVAVKLDSSGPVLYRVRRTGYRGQPLSMLKFRKMHDGARGAPLTARTDLRLTRVGVFLTRSRLDELPQLWDVLCGRMSIIGPRPEDPQFVALHHAEYAHILTVRPGIIGLSQLAYQAESQIVSTDDPVLDYVERILPQKLTLDQLYARETTLGMDLSVLCWAIVALLLRRPVSVSRSTGAISARRQPGARARSTIGAAHVRWTGPEGNRRMVTLTALADPKPQMATDERAGIDLVERSA